MTEADVHSRREPVVYGILGLIVIAMIGVGVYYLGRWAISAMYPAVPSQAAMSLSGGFGLGSGERSTTPQTPPTVAENVSQTIAMPIETESAKPGTSQGVDESRFYVEGSVQMQGKPLTAGMAKLIVEKLAGDIRTSKLVKVDNQGHFYADFVPFTKGDAIKVQAEVWSEQFARGTSLTEELYFNSPAPLRFGRTPFYVVIGVMTLVSLWVFGYAFSGRHTARKTRVAIVYSYVVICICLLSIVILPNFLVNAFPGLMESMKRAPVGWVFARPDVGSRDSQQQWVLNIGGRYGFPEGEEREKTPVIIGGLAIPSFVIILSVMGATINMTRKVPSLQQQAEEEEQVGILAAIKQKLGLSEAPKTSPKAGDVLQPCADWRTALLSQYMFLVSAPFVAIATYYILSLLGTTRLPIVVLMSFSSGLISEHILVAITDFADDLVNTWRRERTEKVQEGEAPSTAPEKDVKQGEGDSGEQPAAREVGGRDGTGGSKLQDVFKTVPPAA